MNSIMDAISLAINTSYHRNMVLHVHASHQAHPLGTNGGPKTVLLRNVLLYNGRGLYLLNSLLDAISLAINISFHRDIMIHDHVSH